MGLPDGLRPRTKGGQIPCKFKGSSFLPSATGEYDFAIMKYLWGRGHGMGLSKGHSHNTCPRFRQKNGSCWVRADNKAAEAAGPKGEAVSGTDQAALNAEDSREPAGL